MLSKTGAKIYSVTNNPTTPTISNDNYHRSSATTTTTSSTKTLEKNSIQYPKSAPQNTPSFSKNSMLNHSNGEAEASLFGAFCLHGLCGLGLATSFFSAHLIFSVDLLQHTDFTLLLLWVVQFPVVILVYSFYRRNAENCSYLKAVGRGVVGHVVGAVIVATVAVSLGAPVGTKYLWRTTYWSLLMSLLTFTPAAAIFGSSWVDWQRIFANTRPAGAVDFMVCVPAHGAVLGAWFGAWPMPLDWERPWQEWPICVTYGAIIGYTIGMIASLILIFASSRNQHVKKE